MGFADLHIHTTHSWDGTSTVSVVLKKAASQLRLDVIAITDHDEVTGSLEALELAPSYGIEVIPGSEISTAEGHLLALFIWKNIPKRLSLIETLLQIGEQGGIAIAAHPAKRAINSLAPEAIRAALQHPDASRILVGIEVYNAGLFHRGINDTAQRLALTLPVAQVGNSDAHLLWMIGMGKTEFPGRSVVDLRKALKERMTRAIVGEPYAKAIHVFHTFSRVLFSRLGWASGNAEPQAPIRFGRITSAGTSYPHAAKKNPAEVRNE